MKPLGAQTVVPGSSAGLNQSTEDDDTEEEDTEEDEMSEEDSEEENDDENSMNINSGSGTVGSGMQSGKGDNQQSRRGRRGRTSKSPTQTEEDLKKTSERSSWKVSGTFEHGTLWSKGNTIIFSTLGEARASFHDGYIDYTLPQIIVTGILVGDRVTEVIGDMKFVDVANGLECVLRFDANKKTGIDGLLQGKTASDQFRGTIVEKVMGSDRKEEERALRIVEGSWLDGLSCEGRTIWDIHRDRPSDLLFDKERLLGSVLPSDSKYRRDVIALKKGEDETKVTEETRRIVEKQLEDVRLRDKGRQ